MSGLGALHWVGTLPAFEAHPDFSVLIDQDQPVRLLTTILEKGTIPHALLFAGVKGVGKLTAAVIFAMACNCLGKDPGPVTDGDKRFQAGGTQPGSAEPCGICRSCRKILSGNHPDIIFVQPSGNYIKIDQIRSLRSTLAMKPYEAGIRVVLISSSHTMNKPAGNALLKVLEEPPDQTIFILIVERVSELLPTIVSRCQHIRFNPVSREHIGAYLSEKFQFDTDTAMVLASVVKGSLIRALQISNSSGGQEDWMKMRSWLINEIDTLPSKPVSLVLAFAERLSKKKDILSDSLEIIKSYFRDLIVCRYSTEKIINRDFIDRIQHGSQKFSLDSLIKKIEAVESVLQKIPTNVNLRLSLEVMLMRLART